MQQQLDDQYLIPSLLNQRHVRRSDVGDAAARGARARSTTSSAHQPAPGASSRRRARCLEAVPQGEPRLRQGAVPARRGAGGPALPGPRRRERGAGPGRQARLRGRCWRPTAEAARARRRRSSWRCSAWAALHYGRGRVRRSRARPTSACRASPRYWDQALFENGFARFQNDDFGGALGSLQALHAPQFAGRLPAGVVDPQGDRLLLQLPLRRGEDGAGRLRRDLPADGGAAQAAARGRGARS